MKVKLAGSTDLAGFRSEARQLLAHQVPPDEVEWRLEAPADPYTDPELPQASRPRNVARAATAIVPASFTRLCEFVVMHRDPGRFSLLYRLLWRLVHEPNLRNDPVDRDMLQAQHMAHAVRRDIHKMKTTLRMHALDDGHGEAIELGCHEPAHHVLEAAAPWFAKRLAARRWAIFTPERSVRCEGGQLLYGPGLAAEDFPGERATEAQWRACYERVFGPHDSAVVDA
jgi:probable DNA metabolism protein